MAGPNNQAENKKAVPAALKQEANYRHIVRIANVDIPGNKQIRVSLKNINGISFNLAHVICNLTNIDIKKKTGNLTDEEIKKLDTLVRDLEKSDIPTWMFNRRKDYDSGDNKHVLEGVLAFVQDNDLKRLKKTKTLRGIRHQRKLPVRGQRTKSNFRRTKGKVVGVKKKGVAGKK
ncbi:MAG: 30S ribosomal protein S13 [archaeon]|nr:30S ribosomal protein S13 [Nanoarchaeota archaeon]